MAWGSVRGSYFLKAMVRGWRRTLLEAKSVFFSKLLEQMMSPLRSLWSLGELPFMLEGHNDPFSSLDHVSLHLLELFLIFSLFLYKFSAGPSIWASIQIL